MEIREDIFGRKPVIGDTIVYNPPYYKGITYGTVIGITSSGLPQVDGKRGIYVPRTGFAIVII